ncbi:hypothetical protein GGS20DRAFT_565594 [Poronia punctata]|nr:hypothetical protein GGS20DRAFT_565594 [Poronia punctata]
MQVGSFVLSLPALSAIAGSSDSCLKHIDGTCIRKTYSGTMIAWSRLPIHHLYVTINTTWLSRLGRLPHHTQAQSIYAREYRLPSI